VRKKVQPRVAFPGSVQVEVAEVVADELGDLPLYADIGQKLEVDVS